MDDLVVETLVVDDHRIEHIARHQVTIDEVLEIVSGDFVYIQGHHERWLLIGKTNTGRFLTVVLGTRDGPSAYGLVTARPARTDERGFYTEFIRQRGGEDNDQT
jgi:uncharacterized DUF497 family protein